MPAAIVADWEPIRATAVSMGSLAEAARAHGLPYDAVKQEAHRRQWPVGHRVKKLLQQAKAAANTAVTIAQPKAVTVVTSTSEALEKTMQGDRDQYLAAASIATRKAAKALSLKEGEAILGKTRALKDLVDAGHKLHGLDAKDRGATANVVIQVLSQRFE